MKTVWLFLGYQILSQCPKELREEVQQEYYTKILLNSILKKYFSLSFLQAISLKMKEKILGPGEILFTRGSPLQYLYFIQKGEIEYFIQNKEYQRSLLKIDDVNIVDFKLFATGQQVDISIRCQTKTIVAYFSMEDFLDTLKLYLVDQEKFCYLRDQLQNEEYSDIKCMSCGQFRHNIFDCPQLHLVPRKDIIVQRHCYSSQQERTKRVQISKRMKYPTLKNQILVRNFLRILRWQKVSEFYNKYSNINIIQEVKILESDRQFFKRCPIINVQKKRLRIKDNENSNMDDIFHLQIQSWIEDEEEEEDDDVSDDYSSSDESNVSKNSSTTNSKNQFNDSFSNQQHQQKEDNPQNIDQVIGDVFQNFTVNGKQIQNQAINMIKEEQEIEESFQSSQIIPQSEENIRLDLYQEQINNQNINSTSMSQYQRSYILQKQLKQNSESQIDQNYLNLPIKISKPLQSYLGEVVFNKDSDEIKEQEQRGSSSQLLIGQANSKSLLQSNQPQVNKNTNVSNNVNQQQQQTNNDSLISIQYQQKNNYEDNASVIHQGSYINKNKDYYQDELSSYQNNFNKQIKSLQKSVNMLQFTILQQFQNLNKQAIGNQQNNLQKKKTIYATASNDYNTFFNKVKQLSKTQIQIDGNKSIHESTFQQVDYAQVSSNKNHIFGKLKFEFEKQKEYFVYYPKGNLSNIIRIFKKIQNKNNKNLHKQLKKKIQFKECSVHSLVSIQDIWKSPTTKLKFSNLQMQQPNSSHSKTKE